MTNNGEAFITMLMRMQITPTILDRQSVVWSTVSTKALREAMKVSSSAGNASNWTRLTAAEEEDDVGQLDDGSRAVDGHDKGAVRVHPAGLHIAPKPCSSPASPSKAPASTAPLTPSSMHV